MPAENASLIPGFFATVVVGAGCVLLTVVARAGAADATPARPVADIAVTAAQTTIAERRAVLNIGLTSVGADGEYDQRRQPRRPRVVTLGVTHAHLPAVSPPQGGLVSHRACPAAPTTSFRPGRRRTETCRSPGPAGPGPAS